jgi:hypothetical protein
MYVSPLATGLITIDFVIVMGVFVVVAAAVRQRVPFMTMNLDESHAHGNNITNST